jgi:hypothetical protein
MIEKFPLQAISEISDPDQIRVAIFINNELVHAPLSAIVAHVMALVGDITEEFSAANIASITASVNTTNKHLGKVVWDTTNGRAMRARGSAAGDIWDSVGEGATTVTPV